MTLDQACHPASFIAVDAFYSHSKYGHLAYGLERSPAGARFPSGQYGGYRPGDAALGTENLEGGTAVSPAELRSQITPRSDVSDNYQQANLVIVRHTRHRRWCCSICVIKRLARLLPWVMSAMLSRVVNQTHSALLHPLPHGSLPEAKDRSPGCSPKAGDDRPLRPGTASRG